VLLHLLLPRKWRDVLFAIATRVILSFCPSVRLSVTFVHVRKNGETYQTFQSSQVSCTKRRGEFEMGSRSPVALNIQVWYKNAIFDHRMAVTPKLSIYLNFSDARYRHIYTVVQIYDYTCTKCAHCSYYWSTNRKSFMVYPVI